MRLAIASLAGQEDGSQNDPVTASQLEAALLERSRPHRAFRRLTGPRLDALLSGSAGASSSGGSSASAGPPGKAASNGAASDAADAPWPEGEDDDGGDSGDSEGS